MFLFRSLTVGKNPVKAENAEIQKAYPIFTKQDGVEIERLSTRINHPDNSGNPELGEMSQL